MRLAVFRVIAALTAWAISVMQFATTVIARLGAGLMFLAHPEAFRHASAVADQHVELSEMAVLQGFNQLKKRVLRSGGWEDYEGDGLDEIVTALSRHGWSDERLGAFIDEETGGAFSYVP